ncbi:sugar ABC transporter ATP-binding protein [Lachnospiraceae bacterium KGMB03038]|nr:sugar ABC transporter ATP-binding protein [Lachnospiraceae bacterium KGMB03038]
MEELALQMKGICKSFSGVQVLDNVSLDVRKGEVHVLLGENGAGKSTLIKILSAAYKKEKGEIFLSGEKLDGLSTKAAIDAGISVIYQEFNLNPYTSVYENIFLGKEFHNGIVIDRKKMISESEKVLKRLGVEINPKALVKNLSVAQKQMVEIAKALSTELKILVLDEPTAAITDKETERLFEVIRKLKEENIGIIYISHRMSELFEIGDRCTVLRDGKYIATLDLVNTNTEELTKLMVNREVQFEKEKNPYINKEYCALRVENLFYKSLLKNISFHLYKGEVLGVAGLVGSGRTEMAKCIIGAYRKDGGKITCQNDTKELKKNNINDAIKKGIVYLSEDRKDEGLILNHSVADNIILPNLSQFGKYILKTKKIPSYVKEYMKRLNVKATSYQQEVRRLSGGNQQKVVIAKWVANNADVYIIDEPTRGIDVGAREEIYNIIKELSQKGGSVIMISSDLVEIMKMSDRIMVMHAGEIATILENTKKLTQKQILEYALYGGEQSGK